MVTHTPIFVSQNSPESVPSPLPTDQRNYNLCVSIASDSNGYGHVTFQRPDTGEIAITFIAPLAIPLQAHLDSLGLEHLQVIDRSLSAGGLTIASSNYLESDQYFRLKRDHCQFVIVTPFFPDVAVNLSRPEDYITNLNWLLDGITRASPGSQIFVLNFYLPHRADFTADNSGRGLTEDRIDAFNRALMDACADGGIVHSYEKVACVDIRSYFEGMSVSYVLAETTKADYEAALYRTNGYSHVIDDYFASSPKGVLIGDGIHLSLAGRDRLAEHLAELLAQLNKDS